MRMHQVVASIVTLALSAAIAFAGGGTALTYQGRLLDAGEPANGLFDFEFGLWDAANGGNPIGVTQVLNNTLVADGLFTVQLDYGTAAFDNTDRWLEIVVDATTLTPRQPITRAPYSIQTRGIFVDQDQKVFVGRQDPVTSAEYFGFNAPVTSGFGGMYISTDGANAQPFYGYAAGGNPDMWHYYDGATGKWHLNNGGNRLTVQSDGNVGIGTTTPAFPLTVQSTGDTTISGRDTATSGLTIGVSGVSASTTGRGVSGMASAFSGVNTGVFGQSLSTSGRGVFGLASANTGVTIGVEGQNASSIGVGVFGWATANTGINYGVFGQTSSPEGFGVFSIGNVCTTGTYLTCSDARFKKNIKPLADSLDKVLKLRGVQFDWKRDEFPDHNFSQDRQVGFIAQELAEVLPDLVAGGEGEDEFYSVSYGRVVPILVEAIKEMNGEAEQKDSQITELQARLTALETLVEQLVSDRNGGAK